MQTITAYNTSMTTLTYGQRFSSMGQRIKARLLTLKLSQKELVGKMKEEGEPVSNAFISQLVTGQRSISVEKLAALARVLRTTTDHLLCMEWADDPELPVPDEVQVVYFSPEADAAARLIDTLTPPSRMFAVNALERLAALETQYMNEEYNGLLDTIETLLGSDARRTVEAGISQRSGAGAIVRRLQ